jgi:superfamily II DNA or RNA helicase
MSAKKIPTSSHEALNLRDYQETLVKELITSISNHKTTIFAASPGAGKTECAVAIIQDALTNNKRVLVFPHATNVLKSQFLERLTKYGIDPKLNDSIVVELPQNLTKVSGTFDLLIVDEAHEWFYADTIQDFLKKNKKIKVLCLTGTPSVFVSKKQSGENLNIIFKPMNELPEEFFAPLTIHLVKTDANITKEDFNQEDELNPGYNWSKKAVEGSLDNLVEAVVEHAKTFNKNNTGLITKGTNAIKGLFSAFSYLEKTLIACHNIAQAKKVALFLEKKGIKVALSESNSDPDSLKVKEFIENKAILVLVVVKRGVLGFSMDSLRCVVDMTASMNLDRIYQLFCRVVRKDNDKKKLFIKVASTTLETYVRQVMCCALALSDRKMLEEFNGDLRTATAVTYKKRESVGGGEDSVGIKVKGKKLGNVKKDLFEMMGIHNIPDFFKDLAEEVGEGCVVYAECDLNAVRCGFFGIQEKNAEKRKIQLLEMAKRGEGRPNWKSKLGMSLSSYTTHDCYDPDFTKQIKKLAPHWFIDTASENKKDLLEMAKRGEGRPNWRNHKLGASLSSYTRTTHNCYDPDFTKQIKELAPHWFVDTASEKKKELLEMAKRGEERPNQRNHKLGKSLDNYIRTTSDCYDPDFTKQIKELAPHWFVDTASEKKKELLEMAKRGEGRPNWRNHKLGGSLSSYTRTTHDCYDPDFTKQIKELAPHWFVDTASENKKELLEMAKRGEERPNQRNHKLGGSLSSYTRTTHNCYDPDFTKQIKELAPHWFKRDKKSSES